MSDQRKVVMDDDKIYRFLFSESWAGLYRPISLTWCMLNPSTADMQKDDPTVKKVRGFTNRLGYNGFQIVNLFAYRSSSPAAMMKSPYPNPLDEKNDLWIMRAALTSPYVLCGWGNDGSHLDRSRQVVAKLKNAGITLKALKMTGQNEPWHPLYLSYALRPVEF